MRYRVLITAAAEDDLRGIYEYIAYDLLSPATAEEQFDRLEKGITKLGLFPYKHSLYRYEPWKSRGLRYYPIDNYIVFFIPDDVNKSVTVIRIIYCGRDIDNQLKKGLS